MIRISGLLFHELGKNLIKEKKSSEKKWNYLESLRHLLAVPLFLSGWNNYYVKKEICRQWFKKEW